MYLALDIGTPVISAYLTNKRIQNEFVRNFPTKIVDGVEVFDRLEFYNGSWVDSSDAAKSIYKLIGTSVRELSDNEYNGIASAWMHLNPYYPSKPVLNSLEIATYLSTRTLPIGESITIDVGYTQVVSDVALLELPAVSNAEILTMVMGGFDSIYPYTIVPNAATGEAVTVYVYENSMVSYDETASEVTFAALMDPNSALFDRSGVVTTKSIVPVYGADDATITSYTIQAIVSFTFATNKEPLDPLAAPLIDLMRVQINAMTFHNSALHNQIRDMQYTIYPVSTDSINLVEQYEGPDGEPLTRNYIKVAGAAAMKPRDFVVLMAYSFDTGYYAEPGDWWVIIIAVIIIALIMYFSFGGGSVPAAAIVDAIGIEAATLVVFMQTLALSLTLSMVALTFVAMAMENAGHYGNAIAMQGSITFLGTMTKFIGAILAITSIYTMVSSAITSIVNGITNVASAVGEVVVPSVTEAAVIGAESVVTPSLTSWVEATIDYAIESVTSLFSDMSTSQVLTKGMANLNTLMSAYSMYINPPPDIPDEEAAAMDNPTSILTPELVQRNFESYGFTDINEVIDAMPYNMTQKLVDQGVSTYYEG